MEPDTIQLSGLFGRVSIKRDKYHIPYIHAENEADAWFGLGFVQGLDRSFQLEYYKRQANGSLSELFGEKFLNTDRFLRTVGFKRLAEKYISTQKPEMLMNIKAFTSGVNSGLFSEGKEEDSVFKLLDTSPTQFEESDVISLHLFLSLALTHWLGKLTRFLILEKESPEIVNKLDPEYAPWNYLIKEVGEKAKSEGQALYNELVEARKILNFKGASNNWVLSGKKTKTGKPILANDPHLAADIPAPLYLASVQGPDFKICGACYPGSPVFFNGHNGNVGWAMTAAFIDNIDLYQEKLNDEGDAVLYDGSFQKCEKVIEKIEIKGKEPHYENVLISKHGPIISPTMRCNDHVFSMCATWLNPKPFEGFFTIHKARDIKHTMSLFKDWPFVSTNLVLADSNGNIGWQLCGEIPDRKKTKGMLPMPGWDSSYDWNETIISYEKNPAIVNPSEGFIATANNKHKNIDSYPYTGRDFIDGYRHRRIINLLKSKEKWDLDETIEMQQDWYSGPWENIREKVLAITPMNPEVEEALEILRNWDGFMVSESVATTIYEYFIAGMTKQIVAEIAPNSQEMIYEAYNPAIGSACFAMSRISQVIKLINEQPEDVFGNKWNEVINSVLDQTMHTLKTELGENKDKWKWGVFRPLILWHPLVRNLEEYKSSEFQRLLNLGPISWGGDEQTLNVAAGSMLDPKVTPDFIPNFRSVISIGDWDDNVFELAGGESADPSSEHYRDLFELWKEGKGIPIAWDSDRIKERTIGEIILEPIE